MQAAKSAGLPAQQAKEIAAATAAAAVAEGAAHASVIETSCWDSMETIIHPGSSGTLGNFRLGSRPPVTQRGPASLPIAEVRKRSQGTTVQGGLSHMFTSAS